MKAILINSKSREVTEVIVGDPILEHWYRLIGNDCSMVEVAKYIRQNMLLVDEEGLFKRQLNFGFYFDGLKLVGNGLVVGYGSRNGTNIDCTEKIEDIKKKIIFF